MDDETSNTFHVIVLVNGNPIDRNAAVHKLARTFRPYS